MHLFQRVVIGVLLIALLGACGRLLPASPTNDPAAVEETEGGQDSAAIESIVASASNVFLSPEDSIQLEFTLTGTGTIPDDVTLESSDTSVATVNESAVVVAVAAGQSTITMTSKANEEISASVVVTVRDALPTAAELGMGEAPGAVGALVNGVVTTATTSIVDAETFTVAAGSLKGNLSAIDPDGAPLPILTDEGFLRPFAGGTLELSGTGYEPGSLLGVSIGDDGEVLASTTVLQDGSYTLTVTIPATLDGNVTLNLEGQAATAAIESTFFGRSRAVFRIRAVVARWFAPDVYGVNVNPSTVELLPDGSQQLTANVHAANGADKGVTWSSSNSSVATVSDNGMVQAVGAGTATITATSKQDRSKSGSATVTVSLLPADLTLSTVTVSPSALFRGDSATVTVTLIQPDGTTRTQSGGTITFAETALGTISNVVDKNDGTYTATFTAGDTTGDAVLTASLDGSAITKTATATIGFFKLAENGVTVICPDASVNDTGTIDGTTYTKRDKAGITALVQAGDGADGWDLLPTTCTSGITDMSFLLVNGFGQETDTFNENIGSWDTSSVTTMEAMFRGANSFNADIRDWSTGEVTSMKQMFLRAHAFDQPIGQWDTSKVTTMYQMFGEDSNLNPKAKFNQDIGDWNTANVTTMQLMFNNADVFNQDISDWDTSKVTTMTGMFANAAAFNQDLSGWCVSLIGSKPSNFDAGSGFVDATERQPSWGNCPTP